MILRSPLLDQIKTIRHGFGTQSEPIPGVTLKHWADRPIWKQIHGTEISRVHQSGQNCGSVDALVTQIPQLPIAVVTADCVPLLFAHRSGRSIAAVHAGWRGTIARLTEKLWDLLIQEGEHPREWVAAIGPSIGPCCYEVSPELIENFKSKFPEVDPARWNPRERMLDLGSLHREILGKIGLGSIDSISACTRCSEKPTFYSYRRGDRESRQYSAIIIDPEF